MNFKFKSCSENTILFQIPLDLVKDEALHLIVFQKRTFQGKY